MHPALFALFALFASLHPLLPRLPTRSSGSGLWFSEQPHLHTCQASSLPASYQRLWSPPRRLEGNIQEHRMD